MCLFALSVANATQAELVGYGDKKTTNSFVQKVPKLIADYVIALARVGFEFGALEDNNLAAAIANQTVSLHGSGGFGYSGPGNAQCV